MGNIFTRWQRGTFLRSTDDSVVPGTIKEGAAIDEIGELFARNWVIEITREPGRPSFGLGHDALPILGKSE